MELIRITEQENVDMISIATHGMTDWRKLAFGSVVDKVVKEAECPVLVLRAKTAAHTSDTRQAASSPSAS
jgi:universal stress protein A